jgi:hypothetical protein
LGLSSADARRRYSVADERVRNPVGTLVPGASVGWQIHPLVNVEPTLDPGVDGDPIDVADVLLRHGRRPGSVRQPLWELFPK